MLDVLTSYGIQGKLTEDPGVWVPANGNKSDAKIAAVGVHLRRFVSSYGVGLNVTKEPLWFLRQIVACGLEGKDATSLESQEAHVQGGLEEVADKFVQAFVDRVNQGAASGSGGPRIDEIYRLEEKYVLD